MSPTLLKQIDSIVLTINLVLILFNAWNLKRIRRLKLELQASSEVERRFQNWLQARDQDRAGRPEKIAVPM